MLINHCRPARQVGQSIRIINNKVGAPINFPFYCSASLTIVREPGLAALDGGGGSTG